MTAISSSSRSAQILIEGAHELLGPGKLEQIAANVSLSSPSLQEVWDFLQALERIYGIPGGRGLAFRIGRASFKYALKQLYQANGRRTRDFHLLPQQRRLETGLRFLAEEIGREWNQTITLSETPSCWIWRVEDCSSGSARPVSGYSCCVLAGLIQEFMAWASGGRFFRVTEVECRASGKPACVFQTDKKPLD